jgi:hypothetical protein
LSLLGLLLLEVIDEFTGLVVGVGDAEFEFALLGPQDHRLALHAADHVEGRARLPAQRQFQEVILDAGFEGLLEFGLDLEEAVGRTEAADALMGTAVVVVADPEFDPLAGGLETLELGAVEELAPEGLPEAFDLAQRHGMMGAALEVSDTVLFELGLEATGAAPGGVLPTVVGEHFLGRLILAGGHAIDLDHRRGGGTAEQIGAHQEARVIIEEADQVGVAPTQPEGEDVRLPHLVGRGPLEEPGPREVVRSGRLGGRQEPLPVQPLSDRFGAGRQQEHPAQELGDALDPKPGVLPLEFQDLFGDRRRELVRPGGNRRRFPQPHLPLRPILRQPPDEGGLAHPHLFGHQRLTKAVLQNQSNRFELEVRRIANGRRSPRAAPGRLPLLYYLFVVHVTLHSFLWSVTPFIPRTWLTIWSLAQANGRRGPATFPVRADVHSDRT